MMKNKKGKPVKVCKSRTVVVLSKNIATGGFMKAIVLEAPGVANLREIPVPTPDRGEILIRTKAATVCTSDIIDLEQGLFSEHMPMVMGHEGAGLVAAVGEGVTDIKVGDEVAVHPVMPCFKCTSCKRGLPHLCDDMGHLCFNKPGVFAEYFVTRPDCVRIKPPSMSFAVASLMEPVCVCLEAVARGRIGEGSRVLIAGDGPFGIMINKLCALKKPKQIIHTGFYDSRLKHVSPMTVTLNVNNEPKLAEKILALTEGEEVDAAVLCVSSADALDVCTEVLSSRGTLVIFSAFGEKTPVDLMRVHLKELNIAGCNNDEGFMDDAIRLLSDPSLNLAGIVTHEIPFDQWEEAFRIASKEKESCLKVSMIL
jgi:threonine dehydrogenase-like Zn-dependent dehydrogenase